MLELNIVTKLDVILCCELFKANGVEQLKYYINPVYNYFMKNYEPLFFIIHNESKQLIGKINDFIVTLTNTKVKNLIFIHEKGNHVTFGKNTIFLEWNDYLDDFKENKINEPNVIKLFRPWAICNKDMEFIKNNLNNIIYCYTDIDNTLLSRELTFVNQVTILNPCLITILKRLQENKNFKNYVMTARTPYVFNFSKNIAKLFGSHNEIEFSKILECVEKSENNIELIIQNLKNELELKYLQDDTVVSSIKEFHEYSRKDVFSFFSINTECEKTGIQIVVDPEHSFAIDERRKHERIGSIYKNDEQKNQSQANESRNSRSSSGEVIGLFFDDDIINIEEAKEYFDEENLRIRPIPLMSPQKAAKANEKLIAKWFEEHEKDIFGEAEEQLAASSLEPSLF